MVGAIKSQMAVLICFSLLFSVSGYAAEKVTLSGYHSELFSERSFAVASSPRAGAGDVFSRSTRNAQGAENGKTLILYTGIQTPLYEICRARIREACRRTGRHCDVRNTGSSERALFMANTEGDGDAMRLGNVKEIVPQLTADLIQVPVEVAVVSLSVYSSGPVFPVRGWTSLKGLRNGVKRGVKIAEKNLSNEVMLLPDSERLLLMLEDKRLDTVVTHDIVADYIIRSKGFAGIVKLSPPLVAEPGYVYLHKKHKALVPVLAESLADMKADGSFERLKQETVAELLGE